MGNQKVSNATVIVSNSFWNAVSFGITGVGSIITTSILTRFLGASEYGVYSFFISCIVIGSLFLDFGLGQTLAKYLPRYSNDRINRGLGVQIFLKTSLFQLLCTVTFAGLALATYRYWGRFITLDVSNLFSLVVIAVVSVLPLVLSKQITHFLSATQNFKAVAISNCIAQCISIGLILYLSTQQANLPTILGAQLVTNTTLLFVLCFFIAPLLRYTEKPVKNLSVRDVSTFSALAYVNVILTFVVWSYSEVFFLARYSPIQEVGYYTLAFSIAAMLAAIPGLYLKTVFNHQFELLEKGEDARSDTISSINVKLLSVLFLPFATLITFFGNNLVNLLYGTGFEKVATILPFVLFGTIISTTLGSPIIKLNNDNKLFGKTILITLAGSVVNLLLDYLLIPRFDSIGAGVANFASQLILTSALLAFAFSKLKMRIDWRGVWLVYALNICIFLLLFLTELYTQGILIKLMISLITLGAYFSMIKLFRIFVTEEKNFLISATSFLPAKIRQIIIR